MKWKICAIVMVLVWTAAGLLAQGDRGLITGTVSDASGAVVPGAQVTANHRATNTNYKANTTASGDFTVPALPVGNYQVRVESTGFKTHLANNIVVAAGATVRLDVELELGTTQQTIEVAANALLVSSETARVATEVSSRLVNDLPLIVSGTVRSPFDLAAITPEVAGGGDSSLRIGGGRVGAYGVTLDGTAATVARSDAQVTWSQHNSPSVEALTEFSVESGGFKAETGHASGGTISFVSKSGGNGFHGDVYEFLRNQKLDARGFFAAQKTVYKQNDFGVTVGGPVWLPKIYNGRNRTFFFFSYEGFRNRVGATATPYTVPPPEFFTGDLHNWVDRNNKMIQVYDPATTTLVGSAYQRTPFPNNQIPQSQIDTVSKAIMAYAQPLVKPNVPGIVPGTYGYVRNNAISYGTNQYPNNKYSIKADQVLTSKQKIAFLFGRTREKDLGGGNATPTLPIPLSGNPGYNQSDIYRISHDYTLSPTWLNRFYAGGNNWRQNHGSYTTYKDAPQSDGIPTTSTGWKEKGICVPNFPDCNMAFPIIAFQNTTTTWGVGAPNGSDNIVVEFRDDMTKVYGSHSFKWGYYYNNTHYNGFGLTYIAGQHNFSYLNTAFPLDTSQATGSDFASFLLGQVSGYRLDTNRYIAGQYRSHQMFFQDDWRVSRRLTLNLGLRYEINLAPIYGEDMISNFDATVPNPGADGRLGALVFGGSGPGRLNTRTLAPDWYGGIGPRLGFSYSLDSKTTLRGAATRSYGPVINPMGSTHYSGFVQQITASDTSQGLNPLYTLQGGAPYWAPVPMIDPSVANATNIPYYNGATATRGSGELTYAFNIQRQLGTNMVAEVGYLATLASDIQSTLLAYNQIDYRKLPANLNPFTASGRTLLNSRIDSAAASAAGIKTPFAAFTKLFGSGATVGQASRPYPQYALIDTIAGGGDRLGHSTYHSMQLKLSRRYSAGLTVQASYVLSKALTDSDSYSSSPTPMDALNLRLEKSIAGFDQTHLVKLTYVYELPFGKGKRYLSNKGVASAVLGGWRVAGIQRYSSGTPISIGTTVSFPIFNGTNRATVPTYDGWRAPIKGSKFDPAVDSFLQPVSFFGTQPTTQFGNETRYNPKLRSWPGYSEDISLARTITFKEEKRLDFRCDTFNPLNRTTFSSLGGGATLQNSNWGLWRSQGNSQRRMQVSLKLYW